MVSTLRAKVGGAWVPPGAVADGNLRVKVNGAWVSPAFCYVKSDGAWRNTGYNGPPNPPSDPWVHAWDYNNVQAAWNYASGGPAIAYYEVQLLNSGGGLWALENSTDNISPYWNIGQDQRAQIRVRSVGTNGLVSAWSNLLRIGTGHPSTPNYGYVQRTKDWSTGGSIGYEGTVNNLAGFGVPSNVICNLIHWYLWMSDGSGTISVYPPAFVYGGDRYVEIILNETYVWDRPNWPSPLDGYDGVNFPGNLQFWGNGGRTGFIAREGGENGWLYKRVDGYIWLGGVEYYNNYEIVSWNPEQGNYYW